MTWVPDIIADVRLLPTVEGGRGGPTPSDFFGCPFIMPNGDYHDARMDLGMHGSLAPGEAARLSIKFLNPKTALSKLSIGSVLQLWEGKVIGEATVVDISSGA